MHKACGEIVDILGFGGRTTSARPSTEAMMTLCSNDAAWVKEAFVHKVLPQFSQLISPPKFALSPLIEHYLYPVSTAPINNYNQRKLKKGNK